MLDSEKEEIVWIQGKAFVVKPATADDMERIGKGFFAMMEPEPAPFQDNRALVRLGPAKLVR
ncbi:hypothetical protein MJA45_10130 [Paenibacillus aurantius]|uniref:Uncharacterized protein n=1 Tax=Paenibacillus aurantius TaxID=2918900 RepID=A0AA96LGA2_9BACL|nr:hypothetical protein [Paenibacillus aurantius]WJH32945.1 hypothetical protein N6H14_22255 [Paenibacillus sp. CC-CFT747]WNQ13357.1 hypothetical protein MJA45_10130 [Paenibacillus aurantius]